jgi:RHS repeat-associated protein
MTADGGHRSETLYFNKMWAWHYDGLMNEVAGRNSKHVYLGESRIVTKISRADSSFMGEERIKQYYYHSDHLGSAQVISNAEGEEYERIEYTPYGELWIEKASSASNIDIPYRFTGKERDEETGLYYYGARYLDSKASRWLSADPAVGEYIPGAPVDDEARERNQSLPGMGGVFNLVNLHLYHYAGNNPVKYVDPDGKISVIPILVFAFVLVEGARLDNLTGKQVTGAINDFASQYQTMRKENIRGNDHYNHAMANSKAAQRGSLGKATAQVLSFAREAADVFLKGDTARDVREDNIANRHGRDISPNEDPAEHNAIFDTRREGHRAELPNVENTTPKNIKEFIDAYFTRDELE